MWPHTNKIWSVFNSISTNTRPSLAFQVLEHLLQFVLIQFAIVVQIVFREQHFNFLFGQVALLQLFVHMLVTEFVPFAVSLFAARKRSRALGNRGL